MKKTLLFIAVAFASAASSAAGDVHDIARKHGLNRAASELIADPSTTQKFETEFSDAYFGTYPWLCEFTR